jgi:CTP synthase
VHSDNVIAAIDSSNIYKVPLQYHEEGFDQQVCRFFGIEKPATGLDCWHKLIAAVENSKEKVKIGIVGKYVQLLDAYKSLIQALAHGGIQHHVIPELVWIDSEKEENIVSKLSSVDAILVPGGFGERGVTGKLSAAQYARENKVPYLGICFGMQLAVIEACRNQLGLKDASSTEFGPTSEPVVGLLTEWASEAGIQLREENGDLGGTMRLGSYPCVLEKGSLAHKIYGKDQISERHRHRYEVNTVYVKRLEEVGLHFSGFSPDGALPEIVERKDHPWFIGVQFHPELKSRLFDSHPLFSAFIKAAIDNKKR